MSAKSRPAAVLLFHLRSGGRIVLANTSAQVLLIAALLGLQPSVEQTLLLLIQGLAMDEGLRVAPWILALWAASNSRLGVLRMVPAVHGWQAHLPVASTEHRRALLVALVVCQAPVILLWLLLWIGGWANGLPVRGVSLAGLVVVSLAAAQVTLPVTRGWTRWIAFGALLVGASLSWLAVFTALAGVLFSELFSGPLAKRRKLSARTNHRPSCVIYVFLPWFISWRSVRWGPLTILATSLLPLGAAWLFLRNNELTPEMTRIGVRVGGIVALTIVLPQLAAELRTRRPLWPWSRSLPWSAHRRIFDDASFLAAHATPILLACAWLEPWTLPPLLPLLVYQAIRLATAMRRENDGPTRLAPFAVWEILLVGLWVAVTAWTSVLLVGLVPWAARYGALQEQRLKVTRWRERHHLIAGDPES